MRDACRSKRCRRSDHLEYRVYPQVLVGQDGSAALLRISDQKLRIQAAAGVKTRQIDIHRLVQSHIGADLSRATPAVVGQVECVQSVDADQQDVLDLMMRAQQAVVRISVGRQCRREAGAADSAP